MPHFTRPAVPVQSATVQDEAGSTCELMRLMSQPLLSLRSSGYNSPAVPVQRLSSTAAYFPTTGSRVCS
jgi:hypothetical protein